MCTWEIPFSVCIHGNQYVHPYWRVEIQWSIALAPLPPIAPPPHSPSPISCPPHHITITKKNLLINCDYPKQDSKAAIYAEGSWGADGR